MVILYVIITIAALFGILFITHSIRYNRKLKPIKMVFEKLSDEQKLNVYELISSFTEKPQKGAFLVPFGNTDNTDLVISVPEELDSTWKGKSFKILFKEDKNNPDIEIEIISNQRNGSILKGAKFITVLAPRIVLKNGKENNSWSTRNLMGRNIELKKYIHSLINKQHVDLLTSIVANEPTLVNYYEHLFQIRIGDGLQWIQSHQNVKCDICKKKMKYIFNLPGEFSGKKGYGEFIYFVFGCERHPENIKYTMQAF